MKKTVNKMFTRPSQRRRPLPLRARVVFFVTAAASVAVVFLLPRSDATSAYVAVGGGGNRASFVGDVATRTAVFSEDRIAVWENRSFSSMRRRAASSSAALPPLRSSQSSSDDPERLRNLASKLRGEAKELERTLSETNQGTGGRRGTPPSPQKKKIAYSDMGDSVWELTYRFYNEPENSQQSKSTDEESPSTPRKFYTGKVRIKFRSDGYTDVLSAPSYPPSRGGGVSDVSFRKFWGWDRETSQEDELDYLLFSADAALPSLDADVEERFYFNARVDDVPVARTSGAVEKKELELNEGTVTVKRNIDPSKGFWGIFRGADGILAEFRKVGEFKCRPCHEADEE